MIVPVNNPFYESESWLNKTKWWILPACILAIFCGWFISVNDFTISLIFIALPFATAFLTLTFLFPRIGFISFLIYTFLVPVLGRHITGPQFGLGQDTMLVLTWIGVIFHRSKKYWFRHLNNDLIWMSVVWFVITVFQIANPERPSLEGWFYEMRSATLYWILSIPLVFFIFNKKSDLNLFLLIVITISIAGALYGIKQLYLGTDTAEVRWLEAGAKRTHLLFGKLRVFSFYTEAGQFGASQAHIAIMCIILATGPYSVRLKIMLSIAGMLLFYGMLISGTRGALFAFIGGGFAFLILSGKTKILIIGSLIACLFIGMLKYTSIGSSNAEIVRLRTSLDPNDPSLRVRLNNQAILQDYLSSRPFGAGVGVLGMWGVKYNADKFISTIPPDSLYVKIWAMYGIVGFIIWFGIMLYTTGKCAGIVWETKDPVLRNKLSALAGGAFGILLCSYGNEVLNQMPSSIIVYISWALIWISPRWDSPMTKTIKA